MLPKLLSRGQKELIAPPARIPCRAYRRRELMARFTAARPAKKRGWLLIRDPESICEILETSKCFLTYVVFDAFGIGRCYGLTYTDRKQE